MENTIEIMNEGINCLVKELGVLKTEQFISVMIRERFDYTKWQRQLFADMSVEELNRKAAKYDRKNRFHSAS